MLTVVRVRCQLYLKHSNMETLVPINSRLLACPRRIAMTMANALIERTDSRPLIFNFSDTSMEPHPLALNPGWKAAIPMSPLPTLQHIANSMYAMHAWLLMAETNKIIVSCDDRLRSPVVIASFLRSVLRSIFHLSSINCS